MVETALLCLALNVYFESKSEPIQGQRAVAQVTMNRADNDKNKVCSVVTQPGQFSWLKQFKGPAKERMVKMERFHKTLVTKGTVAQRKLWYGALEVAREALSGEMENIVSNAEYFYNPRIATLNNYRWIKAKIVVARIGNHVFLRDNE